VNTLARLNDADAVEPMGESLKKRFDQGLARALAQLGPGAEKHLIRALLPPKRPY
jgi:hypothetical protein